MKLELSKPLAFLDLETTGLDIVNDRIIEISILKISPDGNRTSFTKRINPEMPIPPESTDIHGITNEDVANEMPFSQTGNEIKQFIGNSDLSGFNLIRFDAPLLAEEFLRNEIEFDMSKRKFIDVQNIFHKMEKRTLEAAYIFYCNKTLTEAHSAEADVKATHEILMVQLEKYKELVPDVSSLHDFSAMNRNVDLAGRITLNSKDEEVFNFGKYKGKTVTEIFRQDPSYYSWMMNADFPRDTKRVLTSLKLREKTKSQ